MPKCTATTKAGKACKNSVTKGCDVCAKHASNPAPAKTEPEHKAEAKAPKIKAPKTKAPKADESSTVTTETRPVTRGYKKALAQENESAPPPLKPVSAPKDARPTDSRRARTVADVGGHLETMKTEHVACGIRGTTSDATSHRGSWLGMLRALAADGGSDDASLLKTCCAVGCFEDSKVGAHAWIWRSRKGGYCLDRAYIIPTCTFHNGREFDNGGKVIVIKAGTPVMSMLPRASYKDFCEKPIAKN
jgi:hypothetical protein